jgi:hypothetical protein
MRATLTDNLTDFEQYVTQLKQSMKRLYDRSVNKDLSQQNWQDLFKRNVTSVLQQAYKDGLAQLQSVSFGADSSETENGFSKATVQALKPFDGFVDELVQYALQKHRTSCALSNFPDEHNPSQDYIAEVLQETAKDWQEFTLQVNAVVLRD